MTVKTTISKQWKGKEVQIQGKKVVNKSSYEIGLAIEGQAKLLCAVNWGYLAASITTQAFDKGTSPENPAMFQDITPYGKPPSLSEFDMQIESPNTDNLVLVGTPVFYGPYVEFGTVRNNAQPFLRPSMDLAMGKSLTIIESNGKMVFKDYLK